MGKCAHCGTEDRLVYEGLCPDCTKKLDGLFEYSDYIVVVMGFAYVAFKVLLFRSFDGPMSFPNALLEVAGIVFATFILYIIAAIVTKFTCVKSKRYRIIWAVSLWVFLAFLTWGLSNETQPAVTRDDYNQLQDDYESLCHDNTDVSNRYDDLIYDLQCLSDSIRNEDYYGYDEIADELDEIVYTHE